MEPIFISAEQEQQSSFSFRDLINLVFKHKYVIFPTFLLVTFLVSWGMFSLPPVYSSTGKVLIKFEQQGNPMFFSGVAAYQEQQQSDPVNRKMETEMQLIDARPVAEEVVRSLNLQYWDLYHKPFVHLLSPVADFYDRMLEKHFSIMPDPEKRGFSDTVEALMKSVSIAPVRSKSAETTSNIVQLDLKAPDPKMAALILQRWMEVYRDHDTKINQEAAERAFMIVETQTNQAYSELQQAQSGLENMLATQSGRQSGNIVTSSRDSGSLTILREQLIQREMELNDAQEIFRPGSERLVNLQRTIEDLRQRIRQDSSSFAQTDNRLVTLEREVTAAETVYLELKKRMSQIELYTRMTLEQLGNRLIIEPASLPRESSWKKDVVLAIMGAFTGLVLGCGFAGFREYMDHTVSTKEQVKKLFNIEVLGTIDQLDKMPFGKYSRPEEMEQSS